LQITISLIAGLLFGLGLIIGGMANPAKVLNFLDVFGTFDPSLAFVMAGALVVTFFGYRFAFRRPSPLFGGRFHLPTATELEPRLIIGPALFGVGWGLSGFCPGPAITSLSLMAPGTLVFVAAMLTGIGLARLASKKATTKRLEANEGKA